MQTSVRMGPQLRGGKSLMFLVGMLLCIPWQLPAQQTASKVTPRAESSLHLGPGDLVEISVYNVPDLSAKTRVSASGDISLPLIDSVHVGGLTAEAAQNLIQKRLSDGGF